MYFQLAMLSGALGSRKETFVNTRPFFKLALPIFLALLACSFLIVVQPASRVHAASDCTASQTQTAAAFATQTDGEFICMVMGDVESLQRVSQVTNNHATAVEVIDESNPVRSITLLAGQSQTFPGDTLKITVG